MPYIVKTLKANVTLPNGKFYAYANSTAQLTDDEYESIAAADFSNGTLELVARVPDDDGGSGTGSVPRFSADAHGAVGDGTTDDYSAILAAMNAMMALSYSGKVSFAKPSIYRMDLDVPGRVARVGNAYASLRFPDRDPHLPKVSWGFEGVGDTCVTRSNPYSGGTAGQVNTGTVLWADYDPDNFTWSGTDKLPCVIAGPDADLVGVEGNHFANFHATFTNLTIRQPTNPSLTAINLEAVSTCRIEGLRIDTTLVLDQIPEPTHPTGGSILLPRSNNNVTVVVRGLLVEGHYTGLPCTELLDMEEGTAYRCKIGIFDRRGNSHPADMGILNVQQCQWGWARWDPSGAAPNLGVVKGGGTTVKIRGIRFEEFDYGQSPSPWHYTPDHGAHIYADENLRGGCSSWSRVNSGSTAPTGVRSDLLVNGGPTGFSVLTYTGFDAATKVTTTNVPVNPALPNAPTIGTATAGIESANVAFTPAGTGGAATSFRAISTPGGVTATGSSSPIHVTGLTAATAYTFTVRAQNAVGNSSESSASNSVTPTAPAPGEQTLFTTGPASNAGADPNTSVGLQVNPNADTSAIGLRFYKPSTDIMGTVTGGIFELNSDGTPIGLVSGTAVTFSPSGIGWQRADFTTPVTLSVGHLYKIEYFTTLGFYSYETHRFDTTFDGAGGAFTVGTIDVPSADTAPTAAANAQGSYHQGSLSLTYAEVASSSHAWYGIDLVFTA
jgi:hypothetical protein